MVNKSTFAQMLRHTSTPSKLEKLKIWDCNKLVAQHWDSEGLISHMTLEVHVYAVVSNSLKQLQRLPTILERRYRKDKGKIFRIPYLHIGVETR